MSGPKPRQIARTDTYDPYLRVGQPRFQTVGGSILIRVNFPCSGIQIDGYNFAVVFRFQDTSCLCKENHEFGVATVVIEPHLAALLLFSAEEYDIISG